MLVLVSTLPGIAAAEETRSGGTVVVAEGETVEGDLTAAGGTVIIDGTVDGDLTAFAGNVYVNGEVTGDIDAFAGNVHVRGAVGGDLSAVSGNVVVEPDGAVEGSLSAAAGNVAIHGTIGEDAEIGAGSITLGPTADIGGDLTYGGELNRHEDAQVGGTVTREGTGPVGPVEVAPTIPWWIGTAYAFFMHLLLGAVLLLVAPSFSEDVADRVITDPLRSGVVGILVTFAVPIALVLLAITVVGIPLSIIGVLLFVALAWVATVYGRFAVGVWLLSLAGTENRWGALVVGLLVVGLLAAVPYLGSIVSFVVFLLGLGALVSLGRNRYRGRGSAPATAGTEPAAGAETTH